MEAYMPDKNGKLTDPEWKKVAEWIRSNAPQMRCHLYGNHEIHVGDQLVSPMPIKGTAELASARLYRLIALTCRKCQSTSFVNVGGVIELPTG